VTQSVELAHVYRAELERDGFGVWAQRFNDDWLSIPGKNHADILVFVDDYPEVYTPDEKREVAELLRRRAPVGTRIDLIAFESSCAAVADELCAMLALEPGHWFTTNGQGRRSATLLKKDEPGLWMCPALSAVWTLARLGVEPYHEAVRGEAIGSGDLAANEILTVLPVNYIANEADVVEILRQLRKPRVSLSRVKYLFT